MITVGTDISVKVLQEGKIVDKVIMYGTAILFSQHKAKILKLKLDSAANKSHLTEFTNPITEFSKQHQLHLLRTPQTVN